MLDTIGFNLFTKRMAKISASTTTIRDTDPELSESDTADLERRRGACGFGSWNEFFRECLSALQVQTAGGDLIANLPEFVMQDRSNKKFVAHRWETSTTKLDS
jgi:hypothetical protein